MDRINSDDKELQLKILKDSMRLWRIQGADSRMMDEVEEIIKIAEGYKNQINSNRTDKFRNKEAGRHKIIDLTPEDWEKG